MTRVVELLQGDDHREGLDAYLELDTGLRSKVRATTRTPLLEWLDAAEANAPKARAGSPRSPVDAILAIEAASGCAERGEDAQVVATLEPHSAFLAAVPRARQLLVTARQNLQERRRIAAESELDQARKALEAGALEQCRNACGTIDPRALDDAGRSSLEQILHELRTRRDVTLRWARIDGLVAAGDLLTARHQLDVLLEAPGVSPDQIDLFRVRLEELDLALRRTWRLRSDGCARSLEDRDPLGEMFGRLPYAECAVPWLGGDRHEAIVAAAHGRYLFLGRVSLDEQRLVARYCLLTPDPMGSLTSMTVDGETIWLIGDQARLLRLDWKTCAPRLCAPLTPLLTEPERLDHAFVLPGGAYLWLSASLPGGSPSSRVIEIDGWRRRREITSSRHLQPLLGQATPVVVGAGYDGGAVLYTERGAVREELAACVGRRVSAITTDGAAGLIVMASQLDDDSSMIEPMLVVDGHVVFRDVLPDSDPDRPLKCASARNSKLAFIYYAVGDSAGCLVAYRTDGTRLESVYTQAAPLNLLLVQDAQGLELGCMWDTSSGIKLQRLGAEPPSFGRLPDHGPSRFLPTFAGYFSCHPFRGEQSDAPNQDVLDSANEAASGADWHKVRELLEAVPLEGMPRRLLAHHCHLLGLAFLRTGEEPSRAHAAWEAGRPHDRDDGFACRLDGCLDLVEPHPGSLPDAWSSPKESPVRQLRAAIVAADRAMEAADVPRAVEVLRRRIVTCTGELQSSARLASAWLATEPADDHERFDKALALARFVAVAQGRVRDLPIDVAWSSARVEAIVAEAEQWLATW